MTESLVHRETTPSAAACCAEFYERDAVQLLLGDSFHPGGRDLSRRLIASLGLESGERVLDVACGPGTTALMMAAEHGVRVTGCDYSEKNIAKAEQSAERPASARFVAGAAERLPFADSAFDAVLCECAVSTFADKGAVASEVVRVLRKGGRFGMSDMAVYSDLPEHLAAFGRGWSCVDDGLTIEGYAKLFEDAGLTLVTVDDESAALVDMVTMLKKKLLLAALGELAGALAPLNVSVAEMRSMLDEAKALVVAKDVRYARLVFARR